MIITTDVLESSKAAHQFTVYIKSRLVGEGKYQNMKWFNVGVKTRLMEGK